MVVEEFLYTGGTSVDVADALGMTCDDVRGAAISALRSLRTAASPGGPCNDNALVALYVIGALDAEETHVVGSALSGTPSLARRCSADRDLVAELCMQHPVEPSPQLYGRLLASLEGTSQLTYRA